MHLPAEPVGRSGRSPAGLALAIVIPLAVVATAYLLWSISDRLRSIGPLDKAAFGWSVVIPIWVATPVVAGFLWRSLSPRMSTLAALVVGLAVAAVTTVLLWRAVAFPDCGTGAIHTPEESVGPSLLLGVVIGGGLAVSGLLATGQARRGRPWRALALGAGVELAMVFVAIVVAAVTLLGPSCQRPSV